MASCNISFSFKYPWLFRKAEKVWIWMKIVIICASNHPGIFDSCWFSAFLCYYPLLSPGALAAPLITKKGGVSESSWDRSQESGSGSVSMSLSVWEPDRVSLGMKRFLSNKVVLGRASHLFKFPRGCGETAVCLCACGWSLNSWISVNCIACFMSNSLLKVMEAASCEFFRLSGHVGSVLGSPATATSPLR